MTTLLNTINLNIKKIKKFFHFCVEKLWPWTIGLIWCTTCFFIYGQIPDSLEYVNRDYPAPNLLRPILFFLVIYRNIVQLITYATVMIAYRDFRFLFIPLLLLVIFIGMHYAVYRFVSRFIEVVRYDIIYIILPLKRKLTILIRRDQRFHNNALKDPNYQPGWHAFYLEVVKIPRLWLVELATVYWLLVSIKIIWNKETYLRYVQFKNPAGYNEAGDPYWDLYPLATWIGSFVIILHYFFLYRQYHHFADAHHMIKCKILEEIPWHKTREKRWYWRALITVLIPARIFADVQIRVGLFGCWLFKNIERFYINYYRHKELMFHDGDFWHYISCILDPYQLWWRLVFDQHSDFFWFLVALSTFSWLFWRVWEAVVYDRNNHCYI